MPGYYWGNLWARRYWAGVYWSKQGDSAPFDAEILLSPSLSGTLLSAASASYSILQTAAVTSGPALSGTLAANATPLTTDDGLFIAGMPLEAALSGTLSAAATVSLGFASLSGAYWSAYHTSRYWTSRYWMSPYAISAEITAMPALSGTLSPAATPAQTLQVVPSSTVLLSGTLSAVASLPFSCRITSSPALSGTLEVGAVVPSVVRRGTRALALNDRNRTLSLSSSQRSLSIRRR